MLTTEQILSAKFTPVTKGTYSADEVDAFIRAVADSYEKSLAENKELIKKISILADKIESYRKDEEAIKLSLLDAHRMAENISKSASEKADAKLEEAELRAKVIVDGATRQSTDMISEAREKAKEIVDNARVAVASLTERAQNETEMAIMSAQQKAVEIVNKAEIQGKEIVGKSKADYEFYTAELARIKKETATFKETVEVLCNSQLKLLSSISDAMVATETAPVEEKAEEVAQAEEIAVPATTEEPVILDEEEAAEKLEPAFEGVTLPVEEEKEEEILEIPVVEEDFGETEEVEEIEVIEEAEEDEDDIFSILEELNFEDITAPAADIDDFVPAAVEEIPAAEENEEEVEEAAEPEIEEIEVVEEIEEIDDDDDDDDFEGFQIDLDSLDDIITDTSEEEQEITSFFNGLFD